MHNESDRTRTLTRADMTDAIHRLGVSSRTSESGEPISREDSARLLETVLEEVAAALSAGEVVKISSFGSFTVLEKAERIGRNPRTGVEAVITPRRSLSFRASHVLRAAMNPHLDEDDDAGEDTT